jgi:membrane protein YdbS with pleckstrin-like domain
MGLKCAGCDTSIPFGINKCPACGAPAPVNEHTRAEVGKQLNAERSDFNSERTIWTGSPEWKAYTFWFIFAAICIFTVVVPILVIIYVLLEKQSNEYKVTSKRIICTCGILSKRTCELDINDIRSTNVSQSILQRILGVGDLEFTTASGPMKEAVIIKINNPESLKEKIRSLKR